METHGTERRLAALLSADVASYSRLIAEDEEHTVRTLAAWREQVRSLVQAHRGRLADFTGDNFLAEFPTALDAVTCALEAQRVLAARNTALPEARRLRFRMGVHLGDVRVEGERIFGNGVNVAARLQELAEPGGLCVSDAVRQEVAAKLALTLDELGRRALALDPESPAAHQVLGLVALGDGRPEEAMRWHERAVDLDPSYFPAHVALAIALNRLGRPTAALAAAQRALRLDPLAMGTRLTLAAVQLGVGRIEEAEELAQLARAENPDSIPPRVMLLGIYTSQDRLAEARATVAEIQAINPQLTAEQAALVIPASRRDGALAGFRRAGLP